MGLVTNHAPFNLLGEVLVDPRAPLFGMAFKARLVLGNDARPSEATPFAGPVGAMAVRALQGPLEDFVRVGEVELRFHILMAGGTEVDLLHLQFLTDRDSVNLMAIITGDCAQLMDRPVELGKTPHLLMTLQAGIRPVFCLCHLKGPDKTLSLCVRMF